MENQTKNWTTEWPTKPGLYHCFGGYKGSDYYKMVICEVRTAGSEDKPFTIWIANGAFVYRSQFECIFWPEPIQELAGANEFFARLHAETKLAVLLKDSKKPWSKEEIKTPYQLSAKGCELFGLDKDNPPTWLLEIAVNMMTDR